MANTTVLFVCPDNALLSPLAEAYFNKVSKGLARAFSAGLNPADDLHPDVGGLLNSWQLSAEGLTPKSLEVFMMPHAQVPDRVVYLMSALPLDLRDIWGVDVPVTYWLSSQVANPTEEAGGLEACFGLMHKEIDQLLDPGAESANQADSRYVA